MFTIKVEGSGEDRKKLSEMLNDLLDLEIDEEVETDDEDEAEEEDQMISREEALDILQFKYLSYALEQIGTNSRKGELVPLPPVLVNRYNNLFEQITECPPDCDEVEAVGKDIIAHARKAAKRELALIEADMDEDD